MDGGYGRSPWFYNTPWFQGTSDANGRFTIFGTPAAETYEVFVVPGGFANPVRVGMIQGGTRDVAITLDTLRPIPITVVRTDGSPVGDVKVWVHDGGNPPKTSSTGYTGADGRDTILRLAPNTPYLLQLRVWRPIGWDQEGKLLPDARPCLLGATRRDWSPAPERIVLVKTVVTAADASGKRVPKATLWVRHAGSWRWTIAREDGTRELLVEQRSAAQIVALAPPTDHAAFVMREGGEALTDLPTQADGEIEVVVQAPTKGR